ncbi:hypothetical protein JTB14_025321 [Gonioctena quinquepunctata]|nr:hypothetical protein JTB14_025321 [Gonioctena quinquepunctata]
MENFLFESSPLYIIVSRLLETIFSGIDYVKCEKCGKEYASESSLYDHRRRDCGTTYVKCEKCGKEYASEYTLYRHRRRDCGTKKRFKCVFCYHRTKRSHDIKKHCLHKHPEQVITEKYYEELVED